MNFVRKQKGFSFVELLIALFIITILVAIPIPFYMQHANRSKASEAVAAMALIRQALRDYQINTDEYFDVGGGNIANPLPTSVSGGSPTPTNAGLEIDVAVAQYFSNHCYSVDSTSPSSARFTNPAPVDFIITTNGGSSVACGNSNCAIHNTDVANFRLEMDNSGRIFISYDGGSNWSAY